MKVESWMKELKLGTEENLSGEHPESIRGWFESLAVASRPLQRRLAETNLNPSWSAKHASETAVIFQFFGIGE